jgi:hypothetical protein
MAPIDYRNYKAGDYEAGCVNYSDCGIGLNTFGYYCCGNAAGIDRVFGFDIGRKKIPSDDDQMGDQLRVFCKLCGIFGCFKLARKELISLTWKKAYERYNQTEVHLVHY